MMVSKTRSCLSLFALIVAGCSPPQSTTEIRTEEATGEEIIVLPDDTPSIDDDLVASEDSATSIDAAIRQYEVEEGRERPEAVPPESGDPSIDDPLIAQGATIDIGPEDVALVQPYQGAGAIVPPQRSDDPVTAFIETEPAERLSMSDAVRLAPRAFETARQILEEQGDTIANHGRAAVLIGLSGKAEAETILTQYVLSGTSRKLNSQSYDARRDAIFALGYLANVSQGEFGLAFLLETSRPEGWAAQDAVWQAPYFDTQAARNNALAQLSIIALVLSGQEAAEDEIQRLVDRQTADGAVFTPAEARELLVELRKVQAMGLEAYSAQRP